jgi:hypothetical protein
MAFMQVENRMESGIKTIHVQLPSLESRGDWCERILLAAESAALQQATWPKPDASKPYYYTDDDRLRVRVRVYLSPQSLQEV